MYDELANLIEENKDNLTRQTVQLEEKLLKIDFGVEQTRLRQAAYKLTYEVMSRYMRSGKPEEWRDFIQNVAQYDLNTGRDSSVAMAMGKNIVSLVKELIDREWSDPAQETLRTRFHRRLDSMNALAQITTTVSHIKKTE